MAYSLSKRIYNLCHAPETVSSLLAKDPELAPSEASKQIFGSHGDLERARQCGNFGDTRPSELFLRVWHDALCALEHDPLEGVVSPPLMGSTGVIPLTVIGPLPDICRHMSNLIARAEHEVFLATNYWKESDASTLITDSLKELSVRAGSRGQKVVVKLIFDRGSPKQVFDNHLKVNGKDRAAKGVGIPAPEEIPNVDLEVVNYHRPVLGTFHSKFMVVDRKFAVACSNNIQDNDNLEMMTHIEGPIVDALYDMSLISWHNKLEPPLPLLGITEAESKIKSTMQEPSFQALLDESGFFRPKTVVELNSADARMKEHRAGDPHYDPNIAAEIARGQSVLTPVKGERLMEVVADHLNRSTHQSLRATAPDCAPEDNMTPFIPHAVPAPFPVALVNRKPWGALNHSCVNTPQNEAWLSAIRHATRSIFIQSPDINAEPLIPALLQAVRRGVEVTLWACLGYNDSGELLPFQGGTNEMVSNSMYKELQEEEKRLLNVCWYVAKDQTVPLHNKFKKRSCHIKLLIVDEHIGIQGSGNQDTQSWYHSQEVNILIDSPSTCGEWLAALKRNQNTHIYGRVSQEDGIWRDSEGKEAEGAIGVNPGSFAWAKGVVGAVNRARGTGGF
ncbi:phospholipase D/nuclease [Saccharata proteae CBS 121410]|uniref:Phospholipase D/nuclease n=1 Tax=Saccharata proteae CBS 121410 TaxID=1314787 RepID=A0A6A5YDP6_9PEZI|nr:phospholipase D/nuclease [Saccharata proteae CBS 121410]